MAAPARYTAAMGVRFVIRPALAVTLLAVAMAGGALVGCTPTPGSTESPSASPSTSGEASASPSADSGGDATSAPVAFSIPLECADWLDLSVVQANFAADSQLIEAMPPEDLAGLLPGPVAEAALAEATQKRGCLWGVPQSDGGFIVIMAELPAASRTTLTDALDTSAFVATTIGSSPAYVLEDENEIGTVTTVYAFADPAWVAITGSGTTASQTPIMADILDHLRALYPSLGN